MKGITGIVVCLLAGHAASAQLRMPALINDTTVHTHSIKAPVNTTAIAQHIPKDYYTQHLGFFCRQELKMQRAKVPVTFRVGTMEQCNRLEQKPGYR